VVTELSSTVDFSATTPVGMATLDAATAEIVIKLMNRILDTMVRDMRVNERMRLNCVDIAVVAPTELFKSYCLPSGDARVLLVSLVHIQDAQDPLRERGTLSAQDWSMA